jgi:hypothetical protein
MGWEDLEWILLAQKRNQCKVLLNEVMNIWVTKTWENY